MKYLLLMTGLSLTLTAACIHEVEVFGSDLFSKQIQTLHNVHIKTGEHYIPIRKLDINAVSKFRTYNIQYFGKQDQESGTDKIPYYKSEDLNNFLELNNNTIKKNEYKRVSVGKSIMGKDIWAIFPRNISRSKTTIIMFGRQHGDESTANWIIEGFLKQIFVENPSWLEQFQVIVYPMINPDGADKKTRYNANRLDLNRSWAKIPSNAKDEAKTVLSHLYKLNFLTLQNAVILDMHGSFTKDFIYTVKKRFVNLNFFNKQKQFVEQLKLYDPFQAGSLRTSNGKKGMARIVLSKQFRINALTHETPRSISSNNKYYRTLEKLQSQGSALAKTITDLY